MAKAIDASDLNNMREMGEEITGNSQEVVADINKVPSEIVTVDMQTGEKSPRSAESEKKPVKKRRSKKADKVVIPPKATEEVSGLAEIISNTSAVTSSFTVTGYDEEDPNKIVWQMRPACLKGIVTDLHIVFFMPFYVMFPVGNCKIEWENEEYNTYSLAITFPLTESESVYASVFIRRPQNTEVAVEP